MRNHTPGLLSIAAILAVVVVAGSGCGGQDVSAASPAAPSSSTAVPSTMPPATTSAGAFVLTEALSAAIQDEYHAEAVYRRVLLDFGNVMPFANIIRAEQNHAAALAALFRSRGLAVPETAWHLDNVPRFASIRDACGAAAQAEIENVAVYDRYLGADLPADVRQVFTNNRAASLDNHLPAFNRCK